MATNDARAEHRHDDGKLRDRAAERRDQDAHVRDEMATTRAKDAQRRDVQAERRDQEAAGRDGNALRSETWRGESNPSGMFSRAAAARRQAASDRRLSRNDRECAAAERHDADLDRYASDGDRAAAAAERTLAAEDRDTSLTDRLAWARERAEASLDGLTGAYLRGPGLMELDRDLSRARRQGRPFVVAFIDIDGLKGVNDTRGHAAGDALLRHLTHALKAKLRPYDIIVRFGGDEFVCGLAGLDMTAAAARMALVIAALATRTGIASVTVGLAQAAPEDSLEAVIGRADASLYHQRQNPNEYA